MKVIYFLILFLIVSNRLLEDKIKIVLENEEFLNQVTDVVNTFKSKDLTKIISTLSDFYLKTKNGTFPCFFSPCEICKDYENYQKCSDTCWSGFFCNPECLDNCELTYC